ncbi:MAG: kinase/pyrophosphorylase, partial [Venatoribacter sp.]
MKRTAFFISDGTGITAETLGNSLLAQFDSIEFERFTLPYVDSLEKAQKVVERINRTTLENGEKVIIVDTIVNKDIRRVIDASNSLNIDIFTAFLAPLEAELKVESSYSVGKSQSITTSPKYLARIEAVNFALDNDDGA